MNVKVVMLLAVALAVPGALRAAETDSPPDLAQAIREAVDAQAPLAPAAAATSSRTRQLRPGAGAVMAAIRTVLPAARTCLAVGEEPRAALVRFRSDGLVDRVALEGDAGTRASDACVIEALGKAQLEAFFDDHYTTRVVVRR